MWCALRQCGTQQAPLLFPASMCVSRTILSVLEFGFPRYTCICCISQYVVCMHRCVYEWVVRWWSKGDLSTSSVFWGWSAADLLFYVHYWWAPCGAYPLGCTPVVDGLPCVSSVVLWVVCRWTTLAAPIPVSGQACRTAARVCSRAYRACVHTCPSRQPNLLHRSPLW